MHSFLCYKIDYINLYLELIIEEYCSILPFLSCFLERAGIFSCWVHFTVYLSFLFLGLFFCWGLICLEVVLSKNVDIFVIFAILSHPFGLLGEEGYIAVQKISWIIVTEAIG